MTESTQTPQRGRRNRRSSKVEAAEVMTPQVKESTDIPSTGTTDDINRPEIEIAEHMPADTKADVLRFMEEPVEVIIAESTNPNDVDLVQLSVNGRNQFCFRGKPAVIKRKYVEVLARTRRTSYTQQEAAHPITGDKTIKMNPHEALRFPFSVIHDPNPRGADWLRSLLSAR